MYPALHTRFIAQRPYEMNPSLGPCQHLRRVMATHRQAWTCTAKLNPPHSGSVSALGVLRPSTACPSLKTADADIFVTGGSDGLLRVWSARKSAAANGPDGAAGARDETTLLQEIDLRGALPLDIALTYLPASQGSANEAEGNTMLMALALTDRRVQIWASRGDVNVSGLVLFFLLPSLPLPLFFPSSFSVLAFLLPRISFLFLLHSLFPPLSRAHF